MNRANSNRIRLGVLAFPSFGFVALLGALTPGIGINPATDPAGFAKAANLVGLANVAGVFAFVLQLYGFQALHSFLAGTNVERPSFVGMILSIAGGALYLPFLGIIAFAGPVAGKAYLNGQVQAVNIISDSTSVTNPATLVVGGGSVLLYILGSILFSIAIWRSKKIPKWSAVAYTVSAPLNIIPHYNAALWITGAVLFLAAGLGIVRGVWKNMQNQ